MKNKLIITGVFCLNFLVMFCQQKIKLQPDSAVAPNGYGQINLVKDYSNPNAGTADLFGKKGTKDFSIPTNYMGNQDAVEGENYFGIITYKGDNSNDWTSVGKGGLSEGKPDEYKYSEYVQIKLPQNLVADKDYEINIKVSLADNSGYATTGLGVYFSDMQLKNDKNNMLTVEPQLSFPNLVSDKNAWTDLKAKFKATGNEHYLVFGCFETNYSINAVANGKSLGSNRAYYYVSSVTIDETVKPANPDADSDGIPDANDKCPKLAGLADNFGCPEIFLYYRHDDATLTAGDKSDLDKVINFLKNNPDINVTITSHTSTSGKAEYNQKLSEKRADNTIEYMVSKGIDKKRLTPKGQGAQFPIGDNKTEEGRTLSRRTVITITK